MSRGSGPHRGAAGEPTDNALRATASLPAGRAASAGQPGVPDDQAAARHRQATDQAAQEQALQRRLRRFVLGHVVAVVGLYGLAMLAGGGLAGTPMPSLLTPVVELPPVGLSPRLATPGQDNSLSARTPDAAHAGTAPEWTRSAEISAPWGER